MSKPNFTPFPTALHRSLVAASVLSLAALTACSGDQTPVPNPSPTVTIPVDFPIHRHETPSILSSVENTDDYFDMVPGPWSQPEIKHVRSDGRLRLQKTAGQSVLNTCQVIKSDSKAKIGLTIGTKQKGGDQTVTIAGGTDGKNAIVITSKGGAQYLNGRVEKHYGKVIKDVKVPILAAASGISNMNIVIDRKEGEVEVQGYKHKSRGLDMPLGSSPWDKIYVGFGSTSPTQIDDVDVYPMKGHVRLADVDRPNC